MADDGIPWINPIGGLGDTLMVSGVLKQVVDRDPSKKFNLVRRTKYLSILKGHPAIGRIGYPPKKARIMDVTYWSLETLGPGLQRPYQILARAFGLPTPVEEKLYVPWDLAEDPILHNMIPWKKPNIVIAPASDSPRKVMSPVIWHRLVDFLRADGMFVMQVGRIYDQHIRNAYCLLGLTTPRQLLSLLRKCDLVITSDNFIMHAAHPIDKPAVVLWGPTEHKMYGYPEHIHIQMPKSCKLSKDEDCIGSGKNKGETVYAKPCPMGPRHCLDQVRPEMIHETVKKALWKKPHALPNTAVLPE